MFKDDDTYEIIPIFLAYNDKLPEECYKKYIYLFLSLISFLLINNLENIFYKCLI